MTEIIEKPNICLSKYRKIRAILYNWKTAERIKAGLNKRAKRVEDKSDRQFFFNVFHRLVQKTIIQKY